MNGQPEFLPEWVPDDLLYTDYYILLYLNQVDEEEVPQRQIVRDTRVENRTLIRIGERLEERGLVDRVAPMNDLRSTVWRLQK